MHTFKEDIICLKQDLKKIDIGKKDGITLLITSLIYIVIFYDIIFTFVVVNLNCITKLEPAKPQQKPFIFSLQADLICFFMLKVNMMA